MGSDETLRYFTVHFAVVFCWTGTPLLFISRLCVMREEEARYLLCVGTEQKKPVSIHISKSVKYGGLQTGGVAPFTWYVGA